MDILHTITRYRFLCQRRLRFLHTYRISMQTAGLAFGGTGLCSYRVRGVDGSCAEHLTVESYTVFICQQSYLLLFGILSPTHSFIPGLKPSFSANPSHCSPSFLLLKYSLHGFPGLFCCYFWAYLFSTFSFSVFTLFSCRVPCGRLSWLMLAFERTLK